MSLRGDLRQETDGPQAEQLEFVPCGQILQDKDNTRSEEKLNPAHIRDILRIKNTFLTMHMQKGSSEVKKGGGTTP